MDELKEKMTDEWLATLVEAVKASGSDFDFYVTRSFANWCFDLAGKPRPKIDIEL